MVVVVVLQADANVDAVYTVPTQFTTVCHPLVASSSSSSSSSVLSADYRFVCTLKFFSEGL